MPRFFFDTDDGDEAYVDREGLELPDREAARKAALTALPDMAREKLPDGDQRVFVVKVRDSGDGAFYVATLSLRAEWRLDGVD